MEQSHWRAEFQLEVILGDLDDPRFERDLQRGAMDEASPVSLPKISSGLEPMQRWANVLPA